MFTQALGIARDQNKLNLSISDDMWLEEFNHVSDDQVVCAKRVGLNPKKVGEWATKPFRFYIQGNQFVSKKEKVAEKNN